MIKKVTSLKTFHQHLDKRYGKIGTKKRTDFEIKAKLFAMSELIKQEQQLKNIKIIPKKTL